MWAVLAGPGALEQAFVCEWGGFPAGWAPDAAGAALRGAGLGGIGGTQVRPIRDAPEAAIRGVARASLKPIWDGQAFQPRLMLPLALSYDHRIIDGADGARFITALSKKLEEVSTLTASADGKRSI